MAVICCAICSQYFNSKTDRAKYCSQRCKDKGKPSASGLTCAACGGAMVRGRTSKPQGAAIHNACGHSYGRGCRCVTCSAKKAADMRAYADSVQAKTGAHPTTLQRRKFRDEFGFWPQVTPSSWIDPKVRRELYERDSWTCAICQLPVDRGAHWNDDMAPSLDHIKPRSLGGTHNADNLRTAHRICNSVRGAEYELA